MVFLDRERLLHHIDQHATTYLEGWEQFHALFNQTRPLRDASAIYDQLLSLFQLRGLQTTLLNNDHAFIYGELACGAPRTLLFYNRYNVKHPGIWDLLAIAVRLMALDLYLKGSGSLPINIKWLLHGSDTSNTSRLRSIVEKHRQQLQADGCLWNDHCTEEESLSIVENMPLLFLGCKGLLCTELSSHITTQPLPSHYGSIAPNAAWRLLWALNRLKDAREEIIIEGFYDSLISIEDDALASLYTLPDTASVLARQWGMQELLLGLQGFQMHYAYLLTPTCTINFIATGDTPVSSSCSLQIPSQARARVDFYLVPGQEPENIFMLLQRHLHNQGFSDIQTHQIFSCPPAYTPLSNAFVQLVRNATATAYGREPLILPMLPENYPLAPLQQGTGMPILVTTSAGTHSSDMALSILQSLKQIALIIHDSSSTGNPIN